MDLSNANGWLKNKNILYAVTGIIGLIFLSGIGWYTQSRAEDDVRNFFDEYEQLDSVSYKDVSYNPLSGTLTLSDIEIEPNKSDFLLAIDSLEIHDVEFDDNIPEHISFSIEGIQLDILELANSFNINQATLRHITTERLADNKLATLFLLGYYKLPVNLDVEISYDQDDEEFEWSFSANADELGELSFSYSVVNLNRRFFKVFDSEWMEGMSVAMLMNFNPSRISELEKIVNTVKKSKLAYFKAEYNDLGLFERIKHFTEIEHNYVEGDAHPFELTEDEKRDQIKQLKRNGASIETAESIINAQANFLVDVDSISIETNIDEPFSLRKLEGKETGRIMKLLRIEGDN